MKRGESLISIFGRIGSLGFTLSILIFGGFFGGLFLDKFLDTGVVFRFVGLAFGILLSIWNLFYVGLPPKDRR
ncbi:AtpZ/AtpI family protein [bacterium]|nr:AtpZ/AtpI family protein [bacterium]